MLSRVRLNDVLGVTCAGRTSALSGGTSVGDDSPVRSARLSACGNEAEALARLQWLNGVTFGAGRNLNGGVAYLRPLPTDQPSCGSGCQRRRRDNGNCARVSDGDPKRGTLLLDWLPIPSDALTAYGSRYLLTPNGGVKRRAAMSLNRGPCFPASA